MNLPSLTLEEKDRIQWLAGTFTQNSGGVIRLWDPRFDPQCAHGKSRTSCSPLHFASPSFCQQDTVTSTKMTETIDGVAASQASFLRELLTATTRGRSLKMNANTQHQIIYEAQVLFWDQMYRDNTYMSFNWSPCFDLTVEALHDLQYMPWQNSHWYNLTSLTFEPGEPAWLIWRLWHVGKI